MSAISSKLNTQVQGKAVVVYNPVAKSREDVVSAEIEYTTLPSSVAVFDKNGREVPSQVLTNNGNKLNLIFLAKMQSAGLEVFDIRENTPAIVKSNLKVTDRSLENDYYKVRFADNGDIMSIWDKKVSKEMLLKPARLEFQQERPKDWPAWNMDWKDRQKAPIDFMDKDAELKIVEQGPVRVTLQVKRKGQNSEITQYFSLAAGEAGKRLEVTNKIDWQSREVSLKASFPLTVSNENATYNLGVGVISRGNNNEKKFEVPSKEWMDLTDNSGKYGVSILEDCKYGSDKPDNNTLRLTLLYTPRATAFDNAFIYQSTQDWGIHDIKYAIYSHKGNWSQAETPWQAKFLNQPLIAFETTKHNGEFGQSISMISINNSQVGLMAFKKMEQGDYYLVRVNELSGNDLKSVKLIFPMNILEAFEVNGQERKIGNADIKNGTLQFDLGNFTIRSFAVKFLQSSSKLINLEQQSVDLPFNSDVISFDENRQDGNFANDQSLPAELLPDKIESEDINFEIKHKTDGENNAVSCNGQSINLPEGNYTKLYMLAAANEDVDVNFNIDGKVHSLKIQKWDGFVGQFYNRILSRDMNSVIEMKEPFVKTDAIAWFASHCHNAYPMRNEAYRYCYLYKYEIDIPNGSKTITFPKAESVKILAMSVVLPNIQETKLLQPLYDNFQGNKTFILRTKKE